MKNNQCLPQVYLVPKKFHCGVKALPQGENQECSVTNNYLNTASKRYCITLNKSKDESNDDSANRTGCNPDIMNKKYLQHTDVHSSKERPFTQDKITPSFHIVCKTTQAERITQFQLITSNKLENVHEKANDYKWCPVDFYERPKNPFKRDDIINITFKEPSLKSLILNGIDFIKKTGRPLNLTAVNICYEVTSSNDEEVHIKSFIDLTNNKTFAHLLGCSEYDEQWEDLFKLVETQLGENFKKMFIQVDSFIKKK